MHPPSLELIHTYRYHFHIVLALVDHRNLNDHRGQAQIIADILFLEYISIKIKMEHYLRTILISIYT